jgi:hypothetical protein
MGKKVLFSQVETTKSIPEIISAAKAAFRSVGGTVDDTLNGFIITQGKDGVSFDFTADLRCTLGVKEIKPERYEIECQITWGMNALSWICLVVGLFFHLIPWIIPILYLMVNPENSYQQAMNRIPAYL